MFLKKMLQWCYSRTERHSEKNGTILIHHFFGSIEICVGGCYQSGPYIDRLFKTVLKRIPRSHPVKQVLLLGLGGGGAIRELHKRFPHAKITAIEYDPVMVDIAEHVYLHAKDLTSTEIILADARDVLPGWNKTFDLILVDLFIGKSVSPLIETDVFLERLAPCLKSDGYLAVNFFLQKKTVSPVFDRFFSRWYNVRYEGNQMAVYRPFGLGNPRDPVPNGFLDKFQSRTWLQTEIDSSETKSIIGNSECLGFRTRFGILSQDYYYSDQEPIIDPLPRFRLVHWQSYTQKRNAGWLLNWLSDHEYQHGIGVITEQNRQSYAQEWSAHARRHRERWLRDDRFEIVETDLETFAHAYHASKQLDWLTRTGFVRVLAFHLKRHPQDVHLFSARDKSTHAIIAGLAVIHYGDIAQTCHTVSFIRDDARHTSVGVGLIDRWYRDGIQEGMRFFNFGLVWKKGDPNAWKGYSVFKRQFHLYLLRYPRACIKIIW